MTLPTEVYPERNEGCNVKHIFISKAEIVTYWIPVKYLKKVFYIYYD